MENNGVSQMGAYWDKRFQDEGKVWGDAPSKTAEYTLGIFREHHVKKILVPGSGYGRNTKLFSTAGFEVTGVEISQTAFEMSKQHDPQATFYNGSVLDAPYDDTIFDAVYCFNVLHLFREADRKSFLSKIAANLSQGGIMFFTVFSEEESSFGKGQEVEQNTFESKPGRPVHYFTDEDLRTHFQGFELLETGLFEDAENHEEGPHTHILRYIAARKPIQKS